MGECSFTADSISSARGRGRELRLRCRRSAAHSPLSAVSKWHKAKQSRDPVTIKRAADATGDNRQRRPSFQQDSPTMCILFLELCENPPPGGFRLVLASNRDEYYRRPTDNAHQWQEAPSVIGGRDREPGREGGTWLAMDTRGHGRIGALLNVMNGPSAPDARPRGNLVADLVRGEQPVDEYMTAVAARGLEYSPFHLVAIDLHPSTCGLWHYSNCSPADGVDSGVVHVRRGRLCLGNSLVQEPFRKVTAGGERFDAILERCARQRERLVEELVGLLKWNHEHLPDANLEARAAKTKASPETQRLCSSIFQRHPTYGTRTHTVILIDDEWRCDFHEWTLEGSPQGPVDPDSSPWTHTHRTYQLRP